MFDLDEFVAHYFYREVSAYSGDKVVSHELREATLIINYERDGESHTVVVTAIELILYVAKYGKFSG